MIDDCGHTTTPLPSPNGVRPSAPVAVCMRSSRGAAGNCQFPITCLQLQEAVGQRVQARQDVVGAQQQHQSVRLGVPPQRRVQPLRQRLRQRRIRARVDHLDLHAAGELSSTDATNLQLSTLLIIMLAPGSKTFWVDRRCHS